MASGVATPSGMKETISSLRNVDRSITRQLPAPVAVVHEADTGGTAGPASYKHSPQPTVTERAALANEIGRPARIQVAVTDEDVKRAEEKAWLRVLWDFDTWVVKGYLQGLDGPAKKDWLKRHYPELFERMEEAINALNEAKAKYEKMKLDKINSLEDMWFMYTFERDVPFMENHIFSMMNSILGIEVQGKTGVPFTQNEAFARGVWNIRRRFNQWAGVGALPIKTVLGSEPDSVNAAKNYQEFEDTTLRMPVPPGIEQLRKQVGAKVHREGKWMTDKGMGWVMDEIIGHPSRQAPPPPPPGAGLVAGANV